MNLNLLSIKKWFSNHEKYLFSYKDGYFVLPYLGNSPYAIVESFKKMPFIRHIENKQLLICNNLFASGKIHYQYIDQEMVLLVTAVEYKKNVTFKKVFDNSTTSDHYVFSFVSNIIKNANHNGIYNGKSFNESVWMLIKPQYYVPTKYSAGTNCLHVDLFVNKKWVEDNLYKLNKPALHLFNEFEKSDDKFLVWSELLHNSNLVTDPFRNLMEVYTKDEYGGYLTLKSNCYNFMDRLIKALNNLDSTENSTISNDEQNVIRAEQIICENIFSTFIGIESLSKEVGMSTTKLKIQFKSKYGMAIYQYFQHKQMQYAFQSLKSNNCQIKILANQLGYKNVSKFSNTFRKHFDVLPSEIIKLK